MPPISGYTSLDDDVNENNSISDYALSSLAIKKYKNHDPFSFFDYTARLQAQFN